MKGKTEARKTVTAFEVQGQDRSQDFLLKGKTEAETKAEAAAAAMTRLRTAPGAAVKPVATVTVAIE
ncbi:MAG: hypothetical protein AMXMBFR36_20790 [Acidobacteriota bacterium]